MSQQPFPITTRRFSTALLWMALPLVFGLANIPAAHAETVDVLGFDATVNGLKFENSWPDKSTYWNIKLPPPVGTIKIGGGGMCGGMVYTVRDCFDSNLLPPATTTNPAAGTPLYNYLVARLTHSFDYDDSNQQISWITKGDADLVKHMVGEEWPKVKSVLDSGEPCPLVITYGHTTLTDPAAIVQALGHCHQVLAYGYTEQGGELTLRIWDPNYPTEKNHTIKISLNINGLNDAHALNWMSMTGHDAPPPPPTPHHFRGFYRSHYEYKDPRKPTSASFLVEAVSSPGVTGLKALPPVAVYRTWTQAVGEPLVRFTGSVHDLEIPVEGFVADAGKPIKQLMAIITTGGDDLRAGNEAKDNADLFLTVGGRLGNKVLTFNNINCNQHWNNNEVHKVILPRPGATSGEVLSLRLHTQFGGGISGDNWNVNEISVVAALPLSAGQIPSPVIRTWLKENGNPIVRFTGSTHDWSHPIKCEPADGNKSIRALNLTVVTGGDDLRAGTGANDNAEAVIILKDKKTLSFSNINQSQKWGNNSTHNVTLPVPPGLTGEQIANVELHTHFGGGMGGDNWNVNGVELQATLDESGAPPRNVKEPPPPRGK